MSAAKSKLKLVPDIGTQPTPEVVSPDPFTLHGNGRLIAAEKFEELARKLRSGELDGARIQWRDNYGENSEMVVVPYSRTSGQVEIQTFKIVEVG